MLERNRDRTRGGSDSLGPGPALPPYDPPAGAYDEMVAANAEVREHYRALHGLWNRLTPAELNERRRAIDLSFLRQGITFNVYGEAAGTERIFPFDLVPRVVPGREWKKIEAGLVQRITALNLFLHDVYHEQRILKDGVIPAVLRALGKALPPRVRGLRGAAGRVHPRLRHRPHSRQATASTWCSRTTAAAPRA